MKYFENHIFFMWEGSLENLYQQIGSYQLFGKISVQEHCMQVFVQKNRDSRKKHSYQNGLTLLPAQFFLLYRQDFPTGIVGNPVFLLLELENPAH
jgi:hypothetical protein